MSEEFFDDDGNIIRTARNHIVWRNRQWVIFEDGDLGCRRGAYYLSPRMLPFTAGGEPWHAHLARKTWVDIDEFSQAYREAVKRNGLSIKSEDIDKWEADAKQYRSIDPEYGVIRTPDYDDEPDQFYGHWA